MVKLIEDPLILFKGLDTILQGIATPLIISLGAVIMRIALFGWHGVRHFAANFFVAIFMGIMCHWVLTGYDLNPSVVAGLTCACALMAKDFLDMLMSDRVRQALVERVIHEIRTFRRKDGERE